MTTTQSKLLTAEDLLRLHSEGVRGELIRGVLHETMSTGVKHGQIVMKLGWHLGNWVYPRELGRLMGSDSGVLLERNPDTVREPDIGFISAEQMPLEQELDSFSEVTPDLAIEVVSPSNDLDDLAKKARTWLSFGSRLVWVVHPGSKSVDVYRPGLPVQTLS